MTISEIIKGCKAHNKKAQFELVKQFSGRLKSTCMLYISNENNVKDVLQESFMIIFSKVKSFKGEGSFEGWMRMITVRCALAWIKKHKRFAKTDEVIVNAVAHSPKIYSLLNANDIIALIQDLPEAYRLVFSLHVIEGYTHSEISKQLDIKESTSRSNLVRARKILQKKVILTDIKIDCAI